MSDLFAVFVVVHAGQRAVGIPVNVRVHTARVPVAGPAHITLETHTSQKRIIQVILWSVYMKLQIYLKN